MAVRNAATGAEGTAPRRGPGRLPKPGATRAILDATRAILEETGFAGLTIDAIARRDDIGPPALYRRWPSKEALIEAALLEIADETLPIANTGAIRGDLIRLTQDFRESLRSPFGQIVVALVGEAIRDPAWRDLLTDFLRRRREHALVIVERAVKRGELPRDIDGSHVLDLVSSPLWVRRILNGDLDEWASDERLERHVDAVLNGIAPRSPLRRPPTTRHDAR